MKPPLAHPRAPRHHERTPFINYAPMYLPGTLPPASTTDDDLHFVFRDNTLLVFRDGEHVRIPSREECRRVGLDLAHPHYLGKLDGRNCFTIAAPDSLDAPAEAEWRGLRSLFGHLDDANFGLAVRASQIITWDSTHRFCGRCGTPTERQANERARLCPACRLTHYPRLSPAIMALVRRGDTLLLARSPHFAPEMFSALAGFVEAGESLEETLAREVREEVGIEIANPRYFGSQSWPFPHSLMIAFVADYAGGEINPQDGEIEAAHWFSVDKLPRLPHPVSISRRLIDTVAREIAAGKPQA